MATTFTLRRKLFAGPAAVAQFASKGAHKAAGYTKSGFGWFGFGNLGNAASGTKTLTNKTMLSQGNAAMANAKTEAQKKAAQKLIDNSQTTVSLTGGQRWLEGAKGAAKLGGTALVAGTVIGAKKVDDAANGLSGS